MNCTSQGPLIVVHVCRSCGEVTERSQADHQCLINGLVRCPHCGYEGDLDIEIRAARSTNRLAFNQDLRL
jgi:predicted RNA-binding Zn-ribbon protein involved in translation (DUF1610 family)